MKKVIPCCPPDCPERSATCHATCKRWADYVILRDMEYAERDKRRRGEYSRVDRLIVNAKYKYVIKQGEGVKSW